MAETMPTYYDVLQVERDATPERVRSAYRKLAQKYHPDKLPGNANAVRAMAAINAAYEVLPDAHSRAAHDLWIRRAERTQKQAAAAGGAGHRGPSPLPATHWPWYLLFATLAVALGTVVTAMYLTAVPARAAAYPLVLCPQPTAQAAAPVPCRRRT